MKFAIIITEELASIKIKEKLLKIFPFKNNIYKNVEIHTLNKRCLDCEDIDKDINADYFIFATIHQSESGKSTLTAHPLGNWAKAEYGGKDQTLVSSSGTLIKLALLNLKEFAKDLNFEISTEQTHHGPYLSKPAMFIEIGSSEKQWQDPKAAEVLARTIIKTIEQFPTSKFETTILFGGGHYNQPSNKIILETEYAISHICSKYYIESLTKELIQQAIEKSQEKIEFLTLDWKGLGPGKQHLIDLLEELKIPYKKYKELKQTS